MPKIAFFGPTGGCVNACLAYTLLNGHDVIALARSPPKLTNQLLEQPGLTSTVLDRHLKIIQGDVTDVESVMKTLIVHESDSGPIELVSSIISGIGGTGTMAYTTQLCEKSNIRIPTLPYINIPDPNITEKSTATQLEALRRVATEKFPSYEAYAAVAPRVTVISGTGIKKGIKRDVPLLFKAMYDILLPIPHADKQQMERLLAAEQERDDNVLCGGVIFVRPSFLAGDHIIAACDQDSRWNKLRVGTEENPALGYTVPRASIGEWMYREVVKTGGDRWVGEGVVLTE